MKYLVDVRRCHLLLQPLERDPRIHVVSVGMADREVTLPVSRSYSDAHYKPVLAHPTWAQCHQVRVTRLKVHGYLLVVRQVRELCRDVPRQFLWLVHLRSDDAIFCKTISHWTYPVSYPAALILSSPAQ